MSRFILLFFLIGLPGCLLANSHESVNGQDAGEQQDLVEQDAGAQQDVVEQDAGAQQDVVEQDVVEQDVGKQQIEVTLGVTSKDATDSQSRLRVLHLSRDSPTVDVFLNAVDTTDVAFKTQTKYISIPSGETSLLVSVDENEELLLNKTFLPEQDYVAVVYDDLEKIKILVLEDDAQQLAADKIRIPITHVAPLVTRGDIYQLLPDGKFGLQLVDDFGFGETEIPPDLPAATYTIGFDANAVGIIAASFSLPMVTPNTFVRAYVYNEGDDAVAVLIQLPEVIVAVPANSEF